MPKDINRRSNAKAMLGRWASIKRGHTVDILLCRQDTTGKTMAMQ